MYHLKCLFRDCIVFKQLYILNVKLIFDVIGTLCSMKKPFNWLAIMQRIQVRQIYQSLKSGRS